MDKRKGKTQYDEYFSDGIVELGRIGNVVTLKNNMSEEQADMHREKLTDNYDEKKNGNRQFDCGNQEKYQFV